MQTTAQAVVVGAGVVGSSVALHLAERGIETLVVDRYPPASGATARSAGLVRAHYPTALEADLAWESITDYFERWGERVGGGCGFTRTGFAFLASEEGHDDVAANTRMLQDEVGVETEMIGPEELSELDPVISVEGVAAAAYEPRGGYADPGFTAISLLRAAQRHGASFEQRNVAALEERDGRLTGVVTEEGTISADQVVLCAGSHSRQLASTIGLDLPISPARIQVALFARPFTVPTHLTMIDAVEDITIRPTADRCTFGSMRMSELEWLEDADQYNPGIEERTKRIAGERLGRRIPDLKGTSQRLGWSGVLDMTPDGRPVMGPAGPEGLYLCCGWSGKGFKKAPAVGSEVARWMAEGFPRREELLAYTPYRFYKGELVEGRHEYGVKTPN